MSRYSVQITLFLPKLTNETQASLLGITKLGIISQVHTKKKRPI